MHRRSRTRSYVARSPPNLRSAASACCSRNNVLHVAHQPNAQLVPHAVTEVREHSVRGRDGVEREVDTIIFGTGFHVDRPADLGARWRLGTVAASPTTWEGTARLPRHERAGFPNSSCDRPNSATALVAIVLIEAQRSTSSTRCGRCAARARRPLTCARVQVAYNERVQAHSPRTVWNAGGLQEASTSTATGRTPRSTRDHDRPRRRTAARSTPATTCSARGCPRRWLLERTARAELRRDEILGTPASASSPRRLPRGRHRRYRGDLGIGHGTFYRYFRNKHDIAGHRCSARRPRIAERDLSRTRGGHDARE